MPEPKRLESHPNGEAADRDSRAETLLVDGLDRFFSGQYDEAIHLWTRVLFLDRSHARARAYIDRARTAIAERQRRSDEMLHLTSELITQGQTDRARDLLTQAVLTSGDDVHAAELRLRLERMERARGGGSAAAVVDAVPIRGWRWLFRSRGVAAGACVVVGVLAAMVVGPSVREWLGLGVASQSLSAVNDKAPVTVLSGSEAAVVRARTLYARGRLAEALQALDRVDPESANRAGADQLRAEIQRILLGARRGAPASGAGETGRP